tara:strand:- start:6911 stop:7945 length:1035 start_codon:yes stop_codon:yes gene_type:complete
MKARTIAKTIDSKMSDWLNSIEDEELRSLVKKDIIVTGGCIASMFLQEVVNDYDVYLKHNKTVCLLAKHYIEKAVELGNFTVPPLLKLSFESEKLNGIYSIVKTGKDEFVNEDDYKDFSILTTQHLYSLTRVEIYVKSQGFAAEGTTEEYKYFESQSPEDTEKFFSEKAEKSDSVQKYRPVFMSANAITLSNKLQVVLRFTGEPEVIHQSYDFVHATNYWTFKDGLVTNAEALESLLAKELIYRGSLYPLASIFRTRKFIQRDWTCHVGNYLKMALQLNELDLFDFNTLREQLTGVDAAYLHEVISAVREQQADNKDFKFNSSYLCQIVDRMMGQKSTETGEDE